MENSMVLDVIRNRWSPYSFSSRPVEKEKLHSIIEAAGYAPSSMNEQPWRFVIVTRETPDTFNDFLGFLEDTNRSWAKTAYALIVSIAKKNFAYKNRPNNYSVHDTGMAVGNMLIQAASMSIYFHQMGGYDHEKVRNYLSLGDDFEPLAIMALGYLGDGSELSDELRKRHNFRKPRKHPSQYAFMNNLNGPPFAT